jgi:hypothetical protein
VEYSHGRRAAGRDDIRYKPAFAGARPRSIEKGLNRGHLRIRRIEKEPGKEQTRQARDVPGGSHRLDRCEHTCTFPPGVAFGPDR